MKETRISRTELESFVPHSGRMLLIDGIVDWQDNFEGLVSVSSIRADNVFRNSENGSVSVIVGFEYMAQTIAVLSGLERHLGGDSVPRLGYIIGVRDYRSYEASLPENEDLYIAVTELFRDGPVVSFECRIETVDRLIAKGTINAYEPDRD